MPAAAIIPALASVATPLLSNALGGSTPTQTPSQPQDLQNTRGQQIGLLNYLLGMGPDPRTQQTGQAQQPQFQGWNGKQPAWGQVAGETPNQSGIGAIGSNPANGPQSAQTPQQRLESLFGPLGITQSGLQTGATNNLQQMLNQPSPADRAINTTLPQLQQNLTGNSSTQGAINGLMGLQTGAGADVTGRLGQIGQGGGSQTGSGAMDQILQALGQGGTSAQQRLAQLGQGPLTGNQGLDSALVNLASGQGHNLSGLGQVGAGAGINPTAGAALGQLSSVNPGLGVLDALHPAFERNLASADQVGGRFGTSNALGRQTATDNYNQLAQQALQQGVTQQTQAASNLGQLGSAADSTNMQGAIASANNQLAGGQSGVNSQLNALQLALQGNQGQGNLALGANSAIAGQQGNATGQSINANQGLNSNVLQALQQLGGFNLAGQAQQGQNLSSAGQLGSQQGQLGNNAASILGQLFGQQGSQNLNTANTAFNAGVTNTQQQNQGQQTAIQLLQQLLGTAQTASIGGPVVSTPGTGTQVGNTLAGLLPYLGTILGHSNPTSPVMGATPTAPNGYGVG
jgi:hypothetical protein